MKVKMSALFLPIFSSTVFVLYILIMVLRIFLNSLTVPPIPAPKYYYFCALLLSPAVSDLGVFQSEHPLLFSNNIFLREWK